MPRIHVPSLPKQTLCTIMMVTICGVTFILQSKNLVRADPARNTTFFLTEPDRKKTVESAGDATIEIPNYDQISTVKIVPEETIRILNHDRNTTVEPVREETIGIPNYDRLSMRSSQKFNHIRLGGFRLGNKVMAMFHGILALQASGGGLFEIECSSSGPLRGILQSCGEKAVNPKHHLSRRVMFSHGSLWQRISNCSSLLFRNNMKCMKGDRWEDYRDIALNMFKDDPVLMKVKNNCTIMDSLKGHQTLHIHLRYGDIRAGALHKQPNGNQPKCSIYEALVNKYSFKHVRIVGELGHPCIEAVQKWSPSMVYISDYMEGVCELMNAYNVVFHGSTFAHGLILFSSNLQRVFTTHHLLRSVFGAIGSETYALGSFHCRNLSITQINRTTRNNSCTQWLLHDYDVRMPPGPKQKPWLVSDDFASRNTNLTAECIPWTCL